MNSFALISSAFVLAAICLVQSDAVSVLQDQDGFIEEPYEDVARSAFESHVRIARATCDLFSFSSKWVTPNHAACAAHCLALGKKGGSCKNTICHCRN